MVYCQILYAFDICVYFNFIGYYREEQVAKLRVSTHDLFDHCFQVSQGMPYVHACMYMYLVMVVTCSSVHAVVDSMTHAVVMAVSMYDAFVNTGCVCV